MSHAPDLVRAAEEGRSSYCFTVVPRAPGPHRPQPMPAVRRSLGCANPVKCGL